MIEPFFDNEGMTLYEGDSMQLLRGLPENSIDCCVTDPPYALVSIQKRFSGPGAAECQYGTDGAYRRAARGFLGKDWDCGETVNNPEFWAEVLRVLKPGGHLLSFGGTRTQHRQVCAIEDAGFEIRDMLCWHYGSGFPKSHNIGKAIDRNAGIEREVIGEYEHPQRKNRSYTAPASFRPIEERKQNRHDVTKPATDDAKQWDGFGTALKPSTETICLARKPLSESSIAANVLKWGTGALNIDKCRIGTSGARNNGNKPDENGFSINHGIYGKIKAIKAQDYGVGRWPANAIFSESAAAELDRQTGMSGSRFFYVPKPSQAERNMGCEGLPLKAAQKLNEGGIQGRRDAQSETAISQGLDASGRTLVRPDGTETLVNRFIPGYSGNNHPCLKPVQLLRYLIKLICPPGGVVLDPFMGSGSTGIAAVCEGVRFVGMERESEYMKIAVARIKHAQCNSGLFDLFDAPETTPPPAQSQQGLFSEESN